jgi:hypothetical protein
LSNTSHREFLIWKERGIDRGEIQGDSMTSKQRDRADKRNLQRIRVAQLVYYINVNVAKLGTTASSLILLILEPQTFFSKAERKTVTESKKEKEIKKDKER